jgi:hypothetical protein
MRLIGVSLALGVFMLALGSVGARGAEAIPAEEQQQPQLSEAQLDQLVAPIALYPDPLLAQVLMASTYPLEVVQADRFAKANKGLKGDKLTEALDKQDWDASVKQLVSTPTVLAMMSDQLDWTEKLGDAVLAQQPDVMDAIQRLRSQAQATGKLETTKQQTVTVSQKANKQIIEIEPSSPDIAYVPYYNPTVVYGSWPYPDYPPYYYPPPPGYIVGGAIATGLAWGAAFAIGHEIWDDFDWDRGDINVDIDRNRNRNINRNVERNFSKWEHNSYHRRGVSYDNAAVRNKFDKSNARAAIDRKLDYRGRTGEQVLKPGQGIGQRGDGNLAGNGARPKVNPNIGKGAQIGGGNLGERAKPSVGQIEQGLKDRAGPGQKANLAKAKAKAKAKGGGGNALDIGDGPRAKDFSKRGQASLGNRGARDFARPSGGGPNFNRGGGGRPHVSRGGGGRASVGRGGGGRGGGGRGGGRRSDINLKQDIVPLMKLGNGLELYRFRYKDGDPTLYVGVMAQDVQKIDPRAVWRARDGYLRVDYHRIGVKFTTWREWAARTGASHSSRP